MEAPDFWDNAEVSQKKMKELKSMKDDMETYQNLVTQKEDMETLIEMSYEENDPSITRPISREELAQIQGRRRSRVEEAAVQEVEPEEDETEESIGAELMRCAGFIGFCCLC